MIREIFSDICIASLCEAVVIVSFIFTLGIWVVGI